MIFLANDPQAGRQAGFEPAPAFFDPLSSMPPMAGPLPECVSRIPGAPVHRPGRPGQAWPFMSRCPNPVAGRSRLIPDLS